MSNTIKTRTFEDVLPIFSIEHNRLIFKDGRVSIGFSISPIEMEKLSGSEYDGINNAYFNALKSLPLKTTVQKVDCYYHVPFQSDRGEAQYFETKTINHFWERPILQHKSYLYITITDINILKTNAFNSLYAYGKAMVKNPFQGIDKRLLQVERCASEFINILLMGGIHANRLMDDDLQEVYRAYFNLEFAENQPSYSRTFGADSNFVCVGEKKANILSMVGQGAVVFNSVKNQYGVEAPCVYGLTLDLNYPHILTSTVLIEDTEQELKALDFEQKINRNLDFLMSQDNKIKMVEIEDFTEEVRTNNKNIVSFNLSLIVWSASDEQREMYIQQGIAGFRRMAGAECFVETIDTANLFIANAPGNGYQNYRWLVMAGDNACVYNNFITNYKTAKEGDLLCDRYRNPLLVNLFNTDLNNQNSVTIGPSGSGKSFTIGNLIIQRFEKGHRQIIIDVGGTYLSAMTALSGKYFEYDPENPLRFNPFLIDRKSDGHFNMTGDKVNFLTSLLSTIWKGSKGEISQAERSVFVKLIPLYFRYFQEKSYEQTSWGKVPSLRGFYEFLKWYEKEQTEQTEYQKIAKSFDFDEFFIVLEPFVYGQYREVLNSEDYEDISAYKLICFDMAKIKSNILLYPIVAMLITELALDQIRLFPRERKYLYMDEAWSMLSDSMGDFVETMYRTVRKNNGAMCIITQGIDEIINSTVGGAIIANAATQIILNHTDKTQVAKLSRHLGFTEHEIDKINSIRVGADFREIFVKQGDYAKVYTLEVSAALNAILTSKPSEREHLRYLQKKYGGNIQFAVNQYIEHKELGII